MLIFFLFCDCDFIVNLANFINDDIFKYIIYIINS